MRLLYDNEIDNSSYTLSVSDYAGTEYIYTNVQDSRLGKKWRSQTISNKMTYGDCESTSSPTIDGTPSGLSNATWARSAVQVQEGSYSWVLTKTSAAAAGDATIYLHDGYSSTTDMHGLLADKSYKIDFYMWSDVATLSNAELTIQEYYSAAWHDVVSFNPGSASTWGNHSSTFRFNSSTTGIRILVKIASAEVVSKVLYLDDIKLYLEPRIFLDVGSGNTINPTSVAILNHNLSSGVNLRLQGNATDDWSSPTVDQSITWNSGNIIQFITASALRYWSILFDDYDNTDGYVECGRIFLGGYSEISGNCQYKLPREFFTNSKVKQNPSGQLFGKKETQLTGYKMNFARWSETDLGKIETFWQDVDITKPFILVIKNSLISTFPSLYCRLTESPKANYVFDDFWSGALSVREVK